jgi:CTP:molybdopterin cytidylyltransferase MocA/HD superfamily phosphodiesterase
MGAFKPLLQIGGRSLLAHCSDLFYQAGIHKRIVVTGYKADAVAKEALRLHVEPVYNSDFAAGMFSSLQAALYLLKDLDGFFLLPVDIPLVRYATLEMLLSAFDGDAVLYPSRNLQRGYPLLIPEKIISHMRNASKEQGLRQVLDVFPRKYIKIWDDGAFMDADTQSDYASLCNRFENLPIGSKDEVEALAQIMMPEKGAAHCRKVAQIAFKISTALINSGCELHRNIIYNAALLHDIAKGEKRHEKRGAELVRRLGLTALSDAIGAHFDCKLNDQRSLSEKEVVCLADKLVMGAKRVSLEQRFERILEKWKDDDRECAAIRRRLQNIHAIQRAVEDITGQTIEKILK